MKRVARHRATWILVVASAGSLPLALEPPDPGELEKYRTQGSLEARVAFAEGLGNHRIAPWLVEHARARLTRIAAGQRVDALTPPPAWRGMPTTGNVDVLALLISFADYPWTNPAVSVESALFGEGTAHHFPYESLSNYYRRSSYGQLEIQGSILGWYETGYPRDRVETNTTARESLIKEALTYYDSLGHDFTRYDNDGDGVLDYLMVFWTGPNTGWSSFWWGYQPEFVDQSYTLDGKRLGTYSWQWEAKPYPGEFRPKTVIHETGHALGLPDYYDYDNSVGPRGGVGGLDMMDSVWGDHNAFSKFVLDWISPQLLTATDRQTYSLGPSSSFPDALVVMPGAQIGNPFDEYFVVQVRDRQQNDSSYPTDGLLIWHVDARLDPTQHNYLYDNSYTEHKLLRLMEADGREEIELFGDAGANDYYVEGLAFGPAAFPNSNRHDGTYTGVGVDSISPFAAPMTFDAFIQSVSELDTPLLNCGPLADQYVEQDEWRYHYLDVQPGATTLEIRTSEATSELTLYARFGSRPGFAEWDCRPDLPGGSETCVLDEPAAGRWWIAVHGAEPGWYTISACHPPTPTCGTDQDCNDGLYCNGVETCDPASRQCRDGADPCTLCNESEQRCDIQYVTSSCSDVLEVPDEEYPRVDYHLVPIDGRNRLLLLSVLGAGHSRWCDITGVTVVSSLDFAYDSWQVLEKEFDRSADELSYVQEIWVAPLLDTLPEEQLWGVLLSFGRWTDCEQILVSSVVLTGVDQTSPVVSTAVSDWDYGGFSEVDIGGLRLGDVVFDAYSYSAAGSASAWWAKVSECHLDDAASVANSISIVYRETENSSWQVEDSTGLEAQAHQALALSPGGHIDTDDDGIRDLQDNCPRGFNPDQTDADEDGAGDLCDRCPIDPFDDGDNDQICGDLDNCPTVANANQWDVDGDWFGDPCDNCLFDANSTQFDLDGDGYGDACDSDLDGDGSTNWFDDDDDDDLVLDDDGDGESDSCQGPPAAACETVFHPFTAGTTSTYTSQEYVGPVTVTVSGVGQAAGSSYSDAFYVFGDPPTEPRYFWHQYNFALWIDGAPAHEVIEIPPYEPDHVYTFSLPTSGQRLSFALGDAITEDNSGEYEIEVCTPPSCDDNCPTVPNLDQWDHDGDGEGDACDFDDGQVSGVLAAKTAGIPAVLHLEWIPEEGALAYNVYRVLLSELSAPEYGTCYRPGLQTPFASVAEEPPPGAGYGYLVTAAMPDAEGPLGRDSEGRERPNHHACP